MSYYYDGALVQVSGTFKDLNGNLTNPTTTTLVVGFYDTASVVPVLVGTHTTYTFGVGNEINNPSTGQFTGNIDTTGKGGLKCYYEWQGEGAIQAPAPGDFWVIPSPPSPPD